ncbi:lysine histidine transporter-like 6 isoform X3 [Arachis ipaensis]|uniref:lysine histidine transporter-like 6 isoform X3 n=1 Tax=Arachis ipaensis TaxID=130454 RepID=UPI000A2B8A09|nr:lysine histidine transporter-like 6 isoform X3 [Arachis ipaensis]
MASLFHCLSSKKVQPDDEKRIIMERPSRRRAKWWHSTFHTVAVIVGAGVLSLPHAMAYLGCYSTIAWVACLSRGQSSNVSYEYKKSSSRMELIWGVCNALGQISFAFAGHAVTLEIQATIPSTPEKPSKIAMWKGVIVAYFINAICYFPVAITGYWAFGRDVSDDVVIALETPQWLIASANLMVFIHMVGSYQVFAMPVYDLIEKVISKRLNIPEGLTLRLVARSAYVACTLFIGVTFPFFGDLLGFFGGFGIGPTSYFLPSIMWLIIKKPKRFSINWFINWASIFIGVCIMLASIVAGLRNIYADASGYRFYHA